VWWGGLCGKGVGQLVRPPGSDEQCSACSKTADIIQFILCLTDLIVLVPYGMSFWFYIDDAVEPKHCRVQSVHYDSDTTVTAMQGVPQRRKISR